MVLNDCLQNDLMIFVYYGDFEEKCIMLTPRRKEFMPFDKHLIHCPIWPWSDFVLIAVIFDMIHCC